MCNGCVRAFILGGLVAALVACAPRSIGERSESLTLISDDGVGIAAAYRPAATPGAPGLVLVHMLGSGRARWDHFAERAQRAGYTSIAIDLRGHGDSTTKGDATLDYRRFTASEWMRAVRDIDAAKRALAERGTPVGEIALIGASIGANLALQDAVRDSAVCGVVLVSPGLEYHGVETEHAIVAYGKRPSLLLVTEGDAYSATSCARLKATAPGQCELRQYPGSAHGNDLLDESEAANDQVLAWLAETLPVKKPK